MLLKGEATRNLSLRQEPTLTLPSFVAPKALMGIEWNELGFSHYTWDKTNGKDCLL